MIAVHPSLIRPNSNQTEPIRAIAKSRLTKLGEVGRNGAPQAGIYATDDTARRWTSATGGRCLQGRRLGTTSEQWQEDPQSTEYIESRALKWIKQLKRLSPDRAQGTRELSPLFENALHGLEISVKPSWELVTHA